MGNERLIWFKGIITPVSQANISILSPTSQYGVNVFEGMRCYWSERDCQLYGFRLIEHFARLINSAKLIGFDHNYSIEDFIQFFRDIIIANNFKEDIAVRQTLFLDGDGTWSSTGPVGMFIAPISRANSSNKKDEGIKCCTSSWERINDRSLSPKIKVGANYVNSRMGQLEAKRNGYDSAIFMNNNGKISESGGACLFIVRDNQLITPPITASILESITRDSIIEIARNDLELRVIERDIDRTELYISDEIFLCGTSIEIVPIINVDKIVIRNGKTGFITEKIKSVYHEIVRGNKPKYQKWLTPIYTEGLL